MSKGARIVCTFILALTLLAGVALAQESKPAARIAAPAAVEKDNAPAAPGEAATPAASPATSPAGGAADGKPQQSPYLIYVMIAGVAILFLLSGRGRKKEAKRRQEMLSQLKKGDKITTIGGIIGTVVEVRDDEVLVKTDESGNVRTKFARWAIRQVGQEGSKADSADEANK